MGMRAEEPPWRVLLLDDDALIRRAWEHWCERNGIALTTAASAQAARAEIAAQAPFDLIICDFHLGAAGDTSAELVRELCAAGLPAVVLTAAPAKAAAVMGSGVPVLRKGIDLAAMLEAARAASAR